MNPPNLEPLLLASQSVSGLRHPRVLASAALVSGRVSSQNCAKRFFGNSYQIRLKSDHKEVQGISPVWGTGKGCPQIIVILTDLISLSLPGAAQPRDCPAGEGEQAENLTHSQIGSRPAVVKPHREECGGQGAGQAGTLSTTLLPVRSAKGADESKAEVCRWEKNSGIRVGERG
jgi:hypothetical protein